MPKEYLRQLRTLTIKTYQKMDELDSLKAAAENVSAGIGSERVQTSPKDRMPDDISRIVDLESEIQKDIQELLILKNKIINEIQGLSNPVYIEILYKRYVEYKQFEEIAIEINYSYRQVLRIHGFALQEFKRCHTMSHLPVL